MAHISPLRYPGGKGCLASVICKLLYKNNANGGAYVEPFAGGAAVGLHLLFHEHVQHIILNDADYRIFAIWKSILTRSNQFVDMIFETPITMEEWTRQREIFHAPSKHSRIKVGFAAFYLNRCNRSGIIMNGGPIGGRGQTGKWKIDARFNRENLAHRVSNIAAKRDRISLFNLDALDLLKAVKSSADFSRVLVYLDPPYYVQGGNLYLNHFTHEDHASLARYVEDELTSPWVMTYDNVPEIRNLYKFANIHPFSLRYSAFESREGKEILITPEGFKAPQDWTGSLRTAV